MVRSLLFFLWLAPRNAAIAVMKLYRVAISPLYGQVCKYYPSCSRYALETYQSQGFVRGTFLSAWRLLRCNPWSGGGIDDPRPRKDTRLKTTPRGFVALKRAEKAEAARPGTQILHLTHKTKGMIHR